MGTTRQPSQASLIDTRALASGGNAAMGIPQQAGTSLSTPFGNQGETVSLALGAPGKSFPPPSRMFCRVYFKSRLQVVFDGQMASQFGKLHPVNRREAQ